MKFEYRLLGPDEVATALKAVRDWEVKDGLLTKTFTFDGYKATILFATMVGYVAESLDHHPDMVVTYGKVVVSMNTHAVHGLSPYDFELARRIDVVS